MIGKLAVVLDTLHTHTRTFIFNLTSYNIFVAFQALFRGGIIVSVKQRLCVKTAAFSYTYLHFSIYSIPPAGLRFISNANEFHTPWPLI